MKHAVFRSAVSARIAVLLLVGNLLLAIPQASAGDVAERFSIDRFRAVYVPRARIADWVKSGEWTPVSAAEFRRLRTADEKSSEAPNSSRLVEARYRAVFADGALRSGTLDATIENQSDRMSSFPLSPTSLILEDVAWLDRPAHWGAEPDGRVLLVVPPGRDRIAARWSHSVRRFSRTYAVELELPPAASSQLRLTIPSGQQVTVPTALVTGPQPSVRPGWSEWLLEFGSRSQHRLQISPVESAAASSDPLFLTQSNTVWDVREDGLRFSASFDIEVVQGQSSELSFSVPGDLTVHRVTAGVDTRLPWTARSEGPLQRIGVQFADPQRGRLRRVQIEGTAPVRLGESWSLPRADLEGGFFISGEAALRVENSLVIDQAQPRGLLPSAVARGDQGQETHFFRQDIAAAELAVTVAYPRSRLTAKSLSELTATDDHWVCQCETEWQATAGSTFLVSAEISADWEVLEVRPAGETGVNETLRWDVIRAGEGRRRINIEFQETLQTGSPKRLLVTLRQLTTMTNSRLSLPVFRPIGCESVRGATFAPSTIALTGEESLDRTDPAAVAALAEYEDFRHISALRRRSERPARLYLSPSDGSELALHLPRSVTAQAWQTVEMGKTSAHQKLTLKVASPGQTFRAIVVYLSGKTAREPLSWELVDPPQKISSRRLPPEAVRERGLPEQGELWELTLPEIENAHWRVRTEWDVPLQSPTSLRLAFVPDADQMFGAVELASPADEETEAQARGMVPLTVAAANAQREELGLGAVAVNRSWRYDDQNDRFQIVSGRIRPDSEGPSRVQCWLQTVIAADADVDLHRLSLVWTPPRRTQPLELAIDARATIRTVRIDGDLVSYSLSEVDGEQRVAVSKGGRDVVIDYETPAPPTALFTRRAIPLPRIDGDADFQWTIAVPSQFQVESLDSALSLTQRVRSSSWIQRLLGVLGRKEGSRFFSPLSPSQGFAQAGDSLNELTAWSSAPEGGAVQYSAIADAVPRQIHLAVSDGALAARLGALSLLVMALGGLLLRAAEFRHRGQTAVISAALLALGAILSPSTFGSLCGSGLVGVLVASLCPQRALKPWRKSETSEVDVPPGSTATFHPPAALTGLAILLLAIPPASAENGKTGNPATSESVCDVLVPYDGNLQPRSEDLEKPHPVVYLPQSVVDRWSAWQKRRAVPNRLLVGPMSIRARMTKDGQLPTEIRFQVTTLDQRGRWLIPLNLKDFSLESMSCFVEGRPHPLVPAQTEAGFAVILQFPPADEAPTDRDSDPASPEGAAHGRSEVGARPAAVAPETEIASRQFEIELRGYPRVALDSATQERATSWALPSAPSAVLRVEAPAALGFVASPGVVRDELGNKGRVFELRSRTFPVDLRWSTSSRSTPLAEVELRLSRFVEVAPACLTIQNHLNLRMLRGVLQQLDLPLPEHVVVQKVAGSGVSGWSVYQNVSGERRLSLELEKPVDAELTVDIAFLTPTVVEKDLVQVLPWDLDRAQDPAVSIRLILRQTALEAQTGYRLLPAVIESETVRNITPESFARNALDWGEARRADFAWQMQESTVISAAIEARVPKKAIRSRQILSLAPHGATLTFAAEIQTSEASAFQHALEVDPRLQIDSISMSEDEANRLSRWSRTGGRVLLHLNAPTRETQDLVIRGRLPLNWPGEFAIPWIRLEDASEEDRRLTILRSRSLDVTVLDSTGWVTDASTPSEDVDTPGVALVGRYRMLSDVVNPPRIRVEPAARKSPMQTVSWLERREKALFWNCQVRLEPPPSAASVTLALPMDALGPVAAESVPPSKMKLSTDAHRTLMTWEHPEGLSEPVTVLLSGPLRVPHEATAPILLPLPSCETCQTAGDWFFATGDVAYGLLPEETSEKAAPLPQWWQSSPASGAPTTRTATKLSSRSPRLALRSVSGAALQLRLAETLLAANAGGGWSARTSWILEPTEAPFVSLKWPFAETPPTVSLDGVPVAALPKPGQNGFAIPLSPGDGVRSLEVRWELPAGIRNATSLPSLEAQEAPPHILRFAAPLGVDINASPAGSAAQLSPLSELSLMASAWQGWKRTEFGGSASTVAEQRRAESLRMRWESIRQQSASSQDQDSRRLRQLTDIAAKLGAPSPDRFSSELFLITPVNDHAVGFQSTESLVAVRPPLLLDAAAPATEITLYRFPSAALRLASAFLLAAALGIAARFASGFALSEFTVLRREWLQIGFAVLWWLWGTASFVAFVLLLSLLVRMAVNSWRRPRAAEIHL